MKMAKNNGNWKKKEGKIEAKSELIGWRIVNSVYITKIFLI